VPAGADASLPYLQVYNSEKELTEDVVAIDGIVYSLEVGEPADGALQAC